MVLHSTRNSASVEKRILRAARAQLPGRRGRLVADYEHGQWWITDRRTGAQWGAHDDNSVDGFCFEQVTQGDED